MVLSTINHHKLELELPPIHTMGEIGLIREDGGQNRGVIFVCDFFVPFFPICYYKITKSQIMKFIT
jgi:hypothetical protein